MIVANTSYITLRSNATQAAELVTPLQVRMPIIVGRSLFLANAYSKHGHMVSLTAHGIVRWYAKRP